MSTSVVYLNNDFRTFLMHSVGQFFETVNVVVVGDIQLSLSGSSILGDKSLFNDDNACAFSEGSIATNQLRAGFASLTCSIRKVRWKHDAISNAQIANIYRA
jgi:hypothetical protein